MSAWNGSAMLEDEWAAETAYETAFEDEWSPELSGYESGSYEDEWETAGYESTFEGSGYEAAGFETAYEDEWESVGYETAGLETAYANEWEAAGFESAYETAAHETAYEDEADPFLPFLAPLLAKAIPLIGKFAMPAVQRLLPSAARAASGVVGSLMGGRPSAPIPAIRGVSSQIRSVPVQAPGFSRPQQATVASLLRRLAGVLGEGEMMAESTEAQFFGANEMHGELAANPAAHEAALTEVLAAEAAHTGSEVEAQALLGAALPITIKIMAGPRALRPIVPALTRANARLVVGLRRSGPTGPQLLRAVPAIQRRAVATLATAARNGRPIPPRLVPAVVAGSAVRVLTRPRVLGPVLIRNTTIRRATVAPPRFTASARFRY